jgi:hypothetical protein
METPRVRRKVLLGTALVLGCVALFYLVYRPWQSTWGATGAEVGRPMPGDEVVKKPTFNATRAVTVNAPPERIWPWIVQIGYGRAGFYSWDILDNDGIASAERIIAEHQGLKVGDLLPLSKSASARVAEMEPPTHLLLVFQSDTASTWAWGLYPIDSRRTRLVTRLRVGADRLTTQLMLDTFEIVMMRKHLLGIKRRAERAEQGS